LCSGKRQRKQPLSERKGGAGGVVGGARAARVRSTSKYVGSEGGRGGRCLGIRSKELSLEGEE
jgi:hypothetical protein